MSKARFSSTGTMIAPRNMIDAVELCCWVHVATSRSMEAVQRSRKVMCGVNKK
jgi:hypothetical protein